MNKYRFRAYLYLTIASLIWGYAGVVIKVTLNELSPALFLTYRFLVSSLIVIPVLLIKGVHMPKHVNYFKLFLAALFGTSINIGFLFYGAKLTSVNDVAIISATAPIIVVIAGAIFLKEHITKQEKVGVLVTLIGISVLILQPILTTYRDGYGSFVGNILLLLSNLGWMGYVIFSKEILRQKVDAFLITAVGFIVGFISLFPFAIAETGSIARVINNITHISLSAHLGVFYMAIFSGVIAYFLYQLGQKTIEVSEAALFSYLQSIFTIIFAATLLHEQMPPAFLVGSIIVVLGIVIAEVKKNKNW